MSTTISNKVVGKSLTVSAELRVSGLEYMINNQFAGLILTIILNIFRSR